LTILPDGTVNPCPRMPIPLGNFKETPLIDIYNSEKAQEIKKIVMSTPSECKKCDFKGSCLGGLRCLTYAVTGKMDKGDINCPIK
jgi:radical SAM protein with 4Fe4S-binding SPASM domain